MSSPSLHRRHLLQLSTLAAIASVVGLSACDKQSGTSAKALPAGAAVLALGDSLTSGVGAAAGQDWPSVLAGLTGWQIDNQGISGNTSAQALARLPALLDAQRYDAILIGIGGNDMLRQQSASQMRGNIEAMLEAAKAHCPHVGLIATPQPKLSAALTGSLSDAPVYAELAQAQQVLLIDAVYAQVLSDPDLRADQVHANAQGYARMAELLQTKLKDAGWA